MERTSALDPQVTLKVVVMHFLEDQDVLLANTLRMALERAGCTLIRGDQSFANEPTKVIHFHDCVRKADLLVPLLSSGFCESPELIQEVEGWISFSAHSGRPIICPVLLDEIEPPQMSNQVVIRKPRDVLKNQKDFDELASHIRNAALLRLAEAEVLEKQQQDRQAKVEARLDQYVPPLLASFALGNGASSLPAPSSMPSLSRHSYSDCALRG